MTVRDQRRHVRQNARGMALDYLESGKLADDRRIRMVDLSRGGLGIELSGRLPQIGDNIEFCLRLPTGPVTGSGRVRWVVPVSSQDCRCGIGFQKLSWPNRHRLQGYFSPHILDPLRLFDQALLTATIAMIIYVISLMTGFEPALLRDLPLFR